MEACRELLENLYQIVKEETSFTRRGDHHSRARELIEDIETTDQKLKTEMETDKGYIESIQSGLSQARNNSPVSAGQAARASLTVSKYVIIGLAVLAAAILLYVNAPTLP